MGKYLPVQFDTSDSCYVKSFGLEENSALAHWSGDGKNYCILHFVVSGKGFFRHHPVSEEQGFFIPYGAPYEYHSSAEEPWNYFWIIFSADLAKKYVARCLSPNENGIFSYSFRLPLLELCRRLFTCKTLSHEKALSVFFEILSFRHDTLDTAADMQHIHIRRAKAFIERNMHRPFSVSDVARFIHIDERYMYNLFRRHEHISPKTYIIQKRIELACGILNDTGLSITEVAGMVGFRDVCDFSSFFSKHTGLSPTAYRNHARGGQEEKKHSENTIMQTDSE